MPRIARLPAPIARLTTGLSADPTQSGQILVLFALFATVMLGAVGLSVDLGMAMSQRRSMQNAADAGALAGTHVVSKSLPTAPLSAWSAVDTAVRANTMAVGTLGTITCTYVNDANSSLGSCTQIAPVAATGVHVEVVETHPTYFIRVVPGAPAQVSTGAKATAHVKKLAAPRDGPFLPCTINTKLAGGGTLSLLLKSGSSWVMNPAAIGQTFQIHGPQIEKCDAKASRFKGLADVAQNRNKTAPDWFNYKEGDAAGLIAEDVEGPDGCKAGQEIVNCVVFLPIVVNTPAEVGNDKQLWTVAFAPFYITAPKSNEHYGTLLADYLVAGKGQNGDYGWTQGYTGPITIRLTE
jgi:Flp pilus assembly protein TadG